MAKPDPNTLNTADAEAQLTEVAIPTLTEVITEAEQSEALEQNAIANDELAVAPSKTDSDDKALDDSKQSQSKSAAALEKSLEKIVLKTLQAQLPDISRAITAEIMEELKKQSRKTNKARQKALRQAANKRSAASLKS